MKDLIIYIIIKFFDTIFFKGQLDGTPIIFYHSISDKKSRLTVDIAKFEKQMNFLYHRGYKSILPKDLNLNALNNQNKFFLITFDDGIKDIYTNALPILEKYNYKAVVFISTDYIGGKSIYAGTREDKEFEMLSKNEIKKLEQAGWCIANHFAAHKNLTKISSNEIRQEHNKAQFKLKSILKNDNSDIVAYPYNRHNKQVMEVLRNLGASMAFNGGNRPYNKKRDNILAIPRIEIDRNVNFAKFRLFFSPEYYILKNLYERLRR